MHIKLERNEDKNDKNIEILEFSCLTHSICVCVDAVFKWPFFTPHRPYLISIKYFLYLSYVECNFDFSAK